MTSKNFTEEQLEQHEIIVDRMIRQYVKLYQGEFPTEDTARWEARMSKIDSVAQGIIRAIIAESNLADPAHLQELDYLPESRSIRILDRMTHMYAKMIRNGFQKDDVTSWEQRLSKLPESEQRILGELSNIDEHLRDALADRYHKSGRGHADRNRFPNKNPDRSI